MFRLWASGRMRQNPYANWPGICRGLFRPFQMYMSITPRVESTLRSCSVVLGSLKRCMSTDVSSQSVLKTPKDSWTFHARSQQQIFTVTALVRCNSHAIQVSYLKCTIQCFLVHPQSCVTIPTFDVITIIFIIPPAPHQRKPRHLWAVFCAWFLSLSGMLPRSIHGVAYLSSYSGILLIWGARCYSIVLVHHIWLIRSSAGSPPLGCNG